MPAWISIESIIIWNSTHNQNQFQTQKRQKTSEWIYARLKVAQNAFTHWLHPTEWVVKFEVTVSQFSNFIPAVLESSFWQMASSPTSAEYRLVTHNTGSLYLDMRLRQNWPCLCCPLIHTTFSHAAQFFNWNRFMLKTSHVQCSCPKTVHPGEQDTRLQVRNKPNCDIWKHHVWYRTILLWIILLWILLRII